MPYFLSPKNLEIGQTLEIGGDEAAHLLFARRLKVGEQVKLQGPDEKRFLCEVLAADKRTLKVSVRENILVPGEPKISTRLFQAVVNQAALDIIFQKTTELQAEEVVIFNSQNTANPVSRQKFEEKKVHWEKVLSEAAKQCERVRPPKLLFCKNFTECLESLQVMDMVVLLVPGGVEKFKNLNTSNIKTLGLVIGPEGGFTQEEVVQVLSLPKAKGVSLGQILLRAETAAISALALAQNL